MLSISFSFKTPTKWQMGIPSKAGIKNQKGDKSKSK